MNHNFGLLLFETSMRVGELCVLKPENVTKEGIVINSTEIYYKDPDTNKTVFEIKDTPRWVLMKEPLSFLNIQAQS